MHRTGETARTTLPAEPPPLEKTRLTYILLSRAKDGFAALKGDLGLRPNYHQLEGRVDAHIFLAVLACQLLRFITYSLGQKGDHRDWPTLRRVLQTHGYATVSLPTRVTPAYLTDGTLTHFRMALDSDTASITAMQRAPSRKLG